MSISDWFKQWGSRSDYTKASDIIEKTGAPTTDDDIETIDVTFAKKTRELIRYLGANNPDIPAIVTANRAGIIGAGVTIQSRIKGNRPLNMQIEEFLEVWGRKGNCETTGRWHLNSALRSMVEFTDKDGGFLIRHHVNPNWEIPYRFEMIELAMIDTSKDDEYQNILNGLQRDEYGRITYVYLYVDRDRTRSEPVSMRELEYFAPVWVSLSQYTAVSKLAAILPTIDKLDQYSDAELQAAVSRAKNGKYWATTLYDDIMQITRDIKDSTERNLMLKDLMSRISSQGLKPDGLTAIPLSDRIEKVDEPSASVYPNIVSNSKQNASSAAGLARQIVYRDSSDSNYSSIKAMMAMAGVEWAIRWDDLRKEIVDPIMRRAITAGKDAGRITAPGFHQNPDAFIKLDYMRVTEIDIEPKKTAEANATNYELGVVSLREIARKRGKDIEDVIRERIEEEQLEERIRAEMQGVANVAV